MPHLMFINYSWYLIVHARNYWKLGWTSVEIQLRFNTSWNSTHLHVKFSTAPFAYIVEAQLKFNSWMRGEIHQLKLNSFACEFFNWSTCLRSWSSTEIHQLKLNSFACEFFNWSSCLHSWSSLKFNSWMRVEIHQLNASWNSPVECELKLTSWMRVETHQLKLNSFACEFFNWSICLHSWSSTEIQQLNASLNSPVECELKLTSWMRVETHQLKLNSFACEFFNWSTCLHSWSSTEIHQLNASWNWPVECELKLTSWNWTHLHVNFSTVHSWNSTEFQLSLGWNSLVESPMFFFVWDHD